MFKNNLPLLGGINYLTKAVNRRKSIYMATKKMLINAVEEEEYRIAVIKEGLLDGFYIESTTSEQKTGNIYKAVVERVEPSLQACFVDMEAIRTAFFLPMIFIRSIICPGRNL